MAERTLAGEERREEVEAEVEEVEAEEEEWPLRRLLRLRELFFFLSSSPPSPSPPSFSSEEEEGRAAPPPPPFVASSTAGSSNSMIIPCLPGTQSLHPSPSSKARSRLTEQCSDGTSGRETGVKRLSRRAEVSA